MTIHEEHPFQTPPDLRDPARRLRGRLAGGVAVVTAGEGEHTTGLTVSSLMILEGEPASVVFAIGETNDLWDLLAPDAGLVVHLLDSSDRAMSDRFAGLRPSPGGLFVDLGVSPSEWGPVVDRWETRAYCRVARIEPLDQHHLVVASIERIDLSDFEAPLIYFRGRYRTLT